jgi:hypothetical protein
MAPPSDDNGEEEIEDGWYFINDDDGTQGPYPTDHMIHWIEEGHLEGETLIAPEGGKEWTTASVCLASLKTVVAAAPLSERSLAIMAQIDAEKAKDASDTDFASMSAFAKQLEAARALDEEAHALDVKASIAQRACAAQMVAMEAKFPKVPLSSFCWAIAAEIDAENEKEGGAMDFGVMAQLAMGDLPAARALDVVAYETQVACAAREAELGAQLAAATDAGEYERCGQLQVEVKEAAAQLEAATDGRAKEWAEEEVKKAEAEYAARRAAYTGAADELCKLCQSPSVPDIDKINDLINARMVDIRHKPHWTGNWQHAVYVHTALINASQRGYVAAVEALIAADPDPAHIRMTTDVRFQFT